MRISFIFFAILTGSWLWGHEVRLRVVDENGMPINGAKTLIAFTTVVIGGEVRREGFTDDYGVFSGSGQAQASVLVRASKDGYYEARLERLPRNRDLDLTVVLPRIIKPIALYALNLRVGEGGPPLHFPIQNKWLGFDFGAGDWVTPYGKGEVTDIRFKFHQEFKGWNYSEDKLIELRQHPYNRGKSEKEIRLQMGKWEGELEISFPSEKEGFVEVQEHFLPYSRLQMPHSAPVDGYGSTWRYTANTYSPTTARHDIGFFLRTRVKLDTAGNIISANYAKVIGDFHFDAHGVVMFAYYFNPTPNDRNLEFDPKRNLFPAGIPGTDVSDP